MVIWIYRSRKEENRTVQIVDLALDHALHIYQILDYLSCLVHLLLLISAMRRSVELTNQISTYMEEELRWLHWNYGLVSRHV